MACGEREERVRAVRAEPFVLVAQGAPQTAKSVARSAELFREVGLDVRVRTRTTRNRPLERVSSGRANLEIAAPPEVLGARDRGRRLVSVGSLRQEPVGVLLGGRRQRGRRSAPAARMHLVLVANADALERDEGRIRAFLAALGASRSGSLGPHDPTEWTGIAASSDQRVSRRTLDPRGAFTNDHLPGRGLDD